MKNLQQFLDELVNAGKTPSVQYAFFDTDAPVFEFRSGLADIRTNRPADRSTTYNLFSVTKTFTALAVMQLVEEGKVDPACPMKNYLPGFPYREPVTVAQLLNHSSGIVNPLPLQWTHLIEEHNQQDRNRFFREIFEKHQQLRFAPGTRFHYSNLGYVLLGQLIEEVSGWSYEQFITDHILHKAGIQQDQLGFTIQPALHAKGYQKTFSLVNLMLGFMINKKKMMGPAEGKWKPFNLFYVNGTAYGGLIGSMYGLMRYAQALLREDAGLIGDPGRKLLFAENIIGGKPAGMCFGWFKGRLKGQTYFAHAGGGGGYYTELRIYPGLKTGSVIFFNRSGMSDERFLDRTDHFFLSGR